MSIDFDEFIVLLSDVHNRLDLSFMQKSKGLKAYTTVEMHCISYIGMIDNPNVTKLSNIMKMTKGAISKIIKKIQKKGAIETYTNPTNKKEIYYKLTSVGQKIFIEHEKLHEKWQEINNEFFNNYTEKDLKIGLNFIKSYYKYLANTLNNSD